MEALIHQLLAIGSLWLMYQIHEVKFSLCLIAVFVFSLCLVYSLFHAWLLTTSPLSSVNSDLILPIGLGLLSNTFLEIVDFGWHRSCVDVAGWR